MPVDWNQLNDKGLSLFGERVNVSKTLPRVDSVWSPLVLMQST